MSPPDPPNLGATALLRLMAWLSPGFPVGGYAYSHGLEYAVEAGLVNDAAALKAWIAAILRHGTGLVDAGLLVAAWKAVRRDDRAALVAIAERADAWRATAETALESAQQGSAFLDAVRAGWPEPRLDSLIGELAAAGRVPVYPVAVGMTAAVAGIPAPETVSAFLQAVAANLISAGVRLIPLGQREGVRALASLENVVGATAALALASDLDDLGTATWMAEWTSMRHEIQYARLFRS